MLKKILIVSVALILIVTGFLFEFDRENKLAATDFQFFVKESKRHELVTKQIQQINPKLPSQAANAIAGKDIKLPLQQFFYGAYILACGDSNKEKVAESHFQKSLNLVKNKSTLPLFEFIFGAKDRELKGMSDMIQHFNSNINNHKAQKLYCPNKL